MSKRIRRALVVSGVVASIVIGVASVRVAADLTAAAAPPPAPPISMQELQAELAAEQARAASLQQELDDLTGVTGQLTSALDATGEQVSADGSTAAQLRARLKAAEARLALVNKLLRQANARLTALGAPIKTPPPISSGGGSGGSKPTPAPKPPTQPTSPPVSFSLAVTLGGGGVIADWTTCSVSGFDSYALVRSRDSEIHYPPEDLDTLVARIKTVSTTAVTDSAAPAGSNWYRVYCLTSSGGEIRTAATTATRQINVP